jgi:type VI secretion system protein ImpH
VSDAPVRPDPAPLGPAPEAVDLYTALRFAERTTRGPRIGTARRRAEDIATLGQDPSLAFPASTITRADRDAAGRLRLGVAFLGLMGPQGPLPFAVTEEAHGWAHRGDDAFSRFLDVVNHRFLELFFRAHADARPAAQHDRPDEDRFLAYVGSVVGLGLSADDPPNGVTAVALAAYAGLLAPRVKSASRLRSFLAGLFAVRVEVEEFMPTHLPLAPDEVSRLGAANARLGVDLVAGASVLSFDDKVRIRIHAATLAEYESFLPRGPNARRVADAVAFYLGPELEFDIELALPADAAPALTLGRAGRLGWTGWLTPRHPGQSRETLNDARFVPEGVA